MTIEIKNVEAPTQEAVLTISIETLIELHSAMCDAICLDSSPLLDKLTDDIIDVLWQLEDDPIFPDYKYDGVLFARTGDKS